MTINVELLLRQLQDTLEDLKIQSMFGLRGIFYADMFLGYLDHKTNELYLRECSLISRLRNTQGEPRTLSLHKKHFDTVQNFYLVPSVFCDSVEAIGETIKQSYRDRLDIEAEAEANRKPRISKLPNMTVAIERLLIKAGITTPEQLAETGPMAAYSSILKVQSVNSKLILKIEGAITGQHEAVIPSNRRAELISYTRNANQQRPQFYGAL